MWKPSERLKYKPSGGQWPTATEAAKAQLYQRLSHKALNLAQRTWVPAMVPWRATDDGQVTPEVLEWYERFAQGKPGAIVVEATGIRDIPSGPLLRIGHDRYIDGLRDIVDVVRKASNGETRLFIQLIDFLIVRRRVSNDKFLNRFLNEPTRYTGALNLPDNTDADVVRETLCNLSESELEAILNPRDFEDMKQGYRQRVTDTDNPDIANLPALLPGLFADAAMRAQTAGFDGVELHFAHAYTMASFLSAKNTRSDGYGGDKASRVRLPLEVFTAVRDAVEPAFAVGTRILSEECIDEGTQVEDAAYFATQFAAAGMDFISLSRGGKFDDAKRPKLGEAMYPYTGPSGYECMPQYISDKQGPFGRNIEPTARIRQAVRSAKLNTPIILAGGFHNFAQAEGALQDNKADVIGFARQAMADPDWFEKVKLGAGAQVRLCEYTNYCEGLDQKHKQVTCNLWDRDWDGDNKSSRCLKSHDGRRRLTAPEWVPVTIIKSD